jgi:putative membrane protein
MIERSLELSEQRTALAEDRTVLASERTFAGWLRTGYAAVGIALGFHALFGEFDPPWAARLIASLFLLIAIAIFVAAQRHATAVRKRLNAHQIVAANGRWIEAISLASIAGSLALGAAIWLLPMRLG